MADKPTTDPRFAIGPAARLLEPDGFRSGGYPFKKVWGSNEANWQFNTLGEWATYSALSSGRYPDPWTLDDERSRIDEEEAQATGIVDSYEQLGYHQFDESDGVRSYDLSSHLGTANIRRVLVTGRYIWVVDSDDELHKWNPEDLIAGDPPLNTYSIPVTTASTIDGLRGDTFSLVMHNSTDSEVYAFDIAGETFQTVAMPGAVSQIVPVRDANKFAAVHQQGGSGETVAILDAAAGGVTGTWIGNDDGLGIDYDSTLDLLVVTVSDTVYVGSTEVFETNDTPDSSGFSGNYIGVPRNCAWSKGRVIVSSGESTSNVLYLFTRYGEERDQIPTQRIFVSDGPGPLHSGFGRLWVNEQGSSLTTAMYSADDLYPLLVDAPGDTIWDDGQSLWKWNTATQTLDQLLIHRPLTVWRAHASQPAPGERPVQDFHVSPLER